MSVWLCDHMNISYPDAGYLTCIVAMRGVTTTAPAKQHRFYCFKSNIVLKTSHVSQYDNNSDTCTTPYSYLLWQKILRTLSGWSRSLFLIVNIDITVGLSNQWILTKLFLLSFLSAISDIHTTVPLCHVRNVKHVKRKQVDKINNVQMCF